MPGVPDLLQAGDTHYLVGHDTLGEQSGGDWRYYLPDHLGSVRQSVDAAGDLVAAREWSPYGEEVGAAQAGLGFTGEWFDAAVGLQYLRARWYHPGTGRFTSRDPWEGEQQVPLSLQPYLYANANPINYNDPSGYFAEATRLSLLDQKADELHVDMSISAMEKFIGLVQYATDILYNDDETVAFMRDISAVVSGVGRFDQPNYYCKGVCNSTVESRYYYLIYRDANWRDLLPEERSFLQVPPKPCRLGICDIGWQDKYRDNSGNQAFHFWAYVWAAYYSDSSIASLINLEHEHNPWVDSKGKSWEDWLLGQQGAELGHRLAAWQSPGWKEILWWGCMPVHKLQARLIHSLRPSEVPNWLLENVADPAAFGPAPIDGRPYTCE